MEQLNTHWMDFHEILYLRVSSKSRGNVPVLVETRQKAGVTLRDYKRVLNTVSLRSRGKENNYGRTRDGGETVTI
jgi:hypothetical protein